MIVINVTKEFEPIIDEFIKDHPDMEMEKSSSRNFGGSTEIIALVTIITPIVIPEITKLISVLLDTYKEMSKEKNRHEEELIKEKIRHREELLKEKNRHNEETAKIHMAQMTITQKHNDYDSQVLVHLSDGENNPNIQALMAHCMKEIRPDET